MFLVLQVRLWFGDWKLPNVPRENNISQWMREVAYNAHESDNETVNDGIPV